MGGSGGPSSPCGSTAGVVVSVANLLCRLDLGVPSVGSVSAAMYGERYMHVWVCGCEGKGWDGGVWDGGVWDGEGQRKQAISESLTNGHRYTHYL